MARKRQATEARADDAFPLYYHTRDLDRFNTLETGDQYSALRNIAYRTPGEPWAGLDLKMSRSKSKRPSDFPSPISDCPVLSPRAWECLAPLIGPCVEPLPVTCGRAEYVLLNVVATCPAFDVERSIGVRRDDWGNVFDVRYWAFTPEVPIEADVFRINASVSRVFLTQRFRRAVERHGLVGLLWYEAPLVRPRPPATGPRERPVLTTTAADPTAGERLRAAITAAFEYGDLNALTELLHPEGRDSMGGYHEALIAAGCRVTTATVRPYVQPDWDVLKTHDFYPPPAWGIDVRLEDVSGRVTDLFFAGAYDEDRETWCISCYRPKATKGRKKKGRG